MRLPTHHPGEELLLDYADGSLPEPAALVLATHLAFCPECRSKVAEMEAVGGALLEDLAPMPVSEACLEALMASLGEDPAAGKASASMGESGAGRVPEPLRSYLPAGLDDLRWRHVVRGLDEFRLPIGIRPTKIRLMRIKAGVAMPRHTHDGNELTLVLQGGFSDENGHYLPGDAVMSGPDHDHRPVADADGDCICLAVTDAPVRLTGRIGRFLNPFLRF